MAGKEKAKPLSERHKSILVRMGEPPYCDGSDGRAGTFWISRGGKIASSVETYRALKALERRGLVEPARYPHETCTYMWRLSPAGRALVQGGLE